MQVNLNFISWSVIFPLSSAARTVLHRTALRRPSLGQGGGIGEGVHQMDEAPQLIGRFESEFETPSSAALMHDKLE